MSLTISRRFFAAALDRRHVVPLRRVEARPLEERRHSDEPVHGRPDFVTHVGDELRLRERRATGLSQGSVQGPMSLKARQLRALEARRAEGGEERRRRQHRGQRPPFGGSQLGPRRVQNVRPEIAERHRSRERESRAGARRKESRHGYDHVPGGDVDRVRKSFVDGRGDRTLRHRENDEGRPRERTEPGMWPTSRKPADRQKNHEAQEAIRAHESQRERSYGEVQNHLPAGRNERDDHKEDGEHDQAPPSPFRERTVEVVDVDAERSHRSQEDSPKGIDHGRAPINSSEVRTV